MSKTGQGFELNWKGKEVLREVERNLEGLLGDFGLAVESETKQELRPGHGVLTGTLRRSIHTAPVDYPWRGDDVPPSPSSPERGGKRSIPTKKRGRILLAVGSGLNYAIWVHQGHGSFSGYHYLVNGLEKARSRSLKMLIMKHQV